MSKKIELCEGLASYNFHTEIIQHCPGCTLAKPVDQSKEPCYDCIAAAERIAELEDDHCHIIDERLLHEKRLTALTSMRTLVGELAEIVEHYLVLANGTDAINHVKAALTKAKDMRVNNEAN